VTHHIHACKQWFAAGIYQKLARGGTTHILQCFGLLLRKENSSLQLVSFDYVYYKQFENKLTCIWNVKSFMLFFWFFFAEYDFSFDLCTLHVLCENNKLPSLYNFLIFNIYVCIYVCIYIHIYTYICIYVYICFYKELYHSNMYSFVHQPLGGVGLHIFFW
jgi:hypothetical protein